MEEDFSQAQSLWKDGNREASRKKAAAGIQTHGKRDLVWRWRFQLFHDLGPEASLLAFVTRSPPPYFKAEPDSEVKLYWKRAELDERNRARHLARSRVLARSLHRDDLVARADYRIAQQLVDEGHPDRAGDVLQRVITWSRHKPDQTLLTTRALNNLSVIRIQAGRYDESIALIEEARAAQQQNPDDVAKASMENNLGWSHLQLGNSSEALEHLKRSVALFHQAGKPEEVGVLRNLAAYHAQLNQMETAEQDLRQALATAAQFPELKGAPIWTDLGELSALRRDVNLAATSIAQARTLARFDGRIKSQDDAHIRMVEAMIQDLKGGAGAESAYGEVAQSTAAWSSMRLEAATRRANWLVRSQRWSDAEIQYRAAEELVVAMRSRLVHDESKLTFFENASNLYNDYVDLLVSRGRDEDALVVADRSRARLLSDYADPTSQGLQIARVQPMLRQGIALFYWLGRKQAYLWIVGAHIVKRVDLAGTAEEIRVLAQKYYEAVSTPSPLTVDAQQAGRRLRDILLAPAAEHLTPDRRVYVVLDDKLGLLNPESLPGLRPKSNWWIDEAVVSVVPSLALLQHQWKPAAALSGPKLLAIGNALESPGFPVLAHAEQELQAISRLFPARVFDRQAATPAGYRNARPAQFEMIHFTAHGKAEAGNPLDSAVVLSKDAQSGIFKLYAREIVGIPIRARLVTISACRGAVSRTYRGEGAVGLAWAFLRAGAGQVVAGIWDVSDEAGAVLMKKFYEGQSQKKSPAVALRDAKRAMISGYPKPYYWAPFELFSGYAE